LSNLSFFLELRRPWAGDVAEKARDVPLPSILKGFDVQLHLEEALELLSNACRKEAMLNEEVMVPGMAWEACRRCEAPFAGNLSKTIY